VVRDVGAVLGDFELGWGNKHTTWRDALDVLGERILVHRDDDFGGIAASHEAIFADADLEPRRQALNVRGENVLAAYRNTHLKKGANQAVVGRLAAGAVDRGDGDAEVI